MKFLLLGSALVLAGCQTTTYEAAAPARILKPVEVCNDVKVPIYGVLDRPASDGEVLSGAIIGGVIGNQLGNGDGKAATTFLGAIIGANAQQNTRRQEKVIVDYKIINQCRTIYQ